MIEAQNSFASIVTLFGVPLRRPPAELRGFAQATYQRIQEIVKTAGWFRSPNLESYRKRVVGTGFAR